MTETINKSIVKTKSSIQIKDKVKKVALQDSWDSWDEELKFEDSQVATDVASACRIGDPECESCQ